ncbi:MAG TPA: Spy/CpxP family protein refolding chaperone [Stellaceae bacterium]|nr:Spy/CpxP family protein refolding chaperone [Stellaceae bacterium]
MVTSIDRSRMNMPSRSGLCSVVLAIVLAPAIGLAQTAAGSASIPPATASPAPAASPPASPAAAVPTPEMSAATRTAVDQRIRTLQSQLGITEAEMPLWSAFAQAMRDNAASTDALFSRRADAVAEMSAVDNMHSYAQIARNYADNTERLATAFDSLYASLSDVQKHAADTLFRQQATAAAHPRARR